MKNKCKRFGFVAITAAIALNALLMTGCGGGGLPIDPPPLTGEGAHYDAINLLASRWSNAEGESGEQWGSADQIKLSDITAVKPEKYDTLQFKISGVSDKVLKHFSIALFQMIGTDWDTFRWLGSSDNVVLPSTFNNYYIPITIWVDINSNRNAVFYVQLVNEESTAGSAQGAVMATIRNFSISLVVDDGGSTDNGGTVIPSPPIDKPGGGNTMLTGTLAEQLAWLKNNVQSDTAYTLTARADEDLDVQFLQYYNRSNITITLVSSGGEKVIRPTGNGLWTADIFRVYDGVTLILGENITLQGNDQGSYCLVFVFGGELIMNDGAKITGNKYDPSAGGSGGIGMCVGGGTFTMNGGEISGNNNGAVLVGTDGTFIMNDGEISGNIHTGGGVGSSGVNIRGGTFTMNGGTISDNVFTYDLAFGAGVAVGDKGTFTMKGGTISGNTATWGGGVFVDDATFIMVGGEISSNVASYLGGGVYVYDLKGTFIMSGGTISGNSAQDGGGVCVANKGKFTSSGGTISGNSASGRYISGIYLAPFGINIYIID